MAADRQWQRERLDGERRDNAGRFQGGADDLGDA
jgi:hypothetical protein